MAEPAFPEARGRGLAIARTAEAMLRALGGAEVAVRVRSNPSGSTESCRLGLASVITEDIAVSPVLVRSTMNAASEASTEFLFAASVLDRVADAQQYGSGSALLESALGIVLHDKLFRIVSVNSDSYAGAEYLYRVSASE